MIHKAFILGAGLGTRLRPLTDLLPKPLIPVFHRPLVTYGLDHCLAAGIRSFAVNTHHLPQAWETAFPKNADEQFLYQNAPLQFFHEADLLETGGGVKNIAKWIGQDPLLIYNGDILTNIDIAELMATHLASGNGATLALRSQGVAPHIAFDEKSGKISDIRGMLGRAEGAYQFTGIYCVSPEILDLIPPDEKISVIPAFLELARQGRLGGVVLDEGSWADLGTTEAYFEIHRHRDLGPRLHPDARIDPAAIVDEFSIVGPSAVVEADAVVKDSILWPSARVSEGCQIERRIVTA